MGSIYRTPLSTDITKQELCPASRGEVHPWMDGERWHHGVGMLCSPVRGWIALNCRTNVNQNVKLWQVHHPAMVIGEKWGKAKLDIPAWCDNFLVIINNKIVVLQYFLPIPKCLLLLFFFLSLSPFFVPWAFFCNSTRLQLCSPFFHSFLVRYCFIAFMCLFNLLLFANEIF